MKLLLEWKEKKNKQINNNAGNTHGANVLIGGNI